MKILCTLECDRVQSLFSNITTAKLPVTECDHEFFFVSIITEICFVHESGYGIFFFHQCDHRQFLLQNVAKE